MNRERWKHRTKLIGPWVIAGYLLFYLGGYYSFGYTHTCVRSHTVETDTPTDRGVAFSTDTVCDWYSANERRWTEGDPVRAIYSVGLGDGGVLLIIAVMGFAIYAGVDYARRRRTSEWLSSYVRSSDQDDDEYIAEGLDAIREPEQR